MNETYKKILSTEEYLAVYRLGEYFDGSEVARFVASKVNERIAEGIRDHSTKEPAVDDKNQPILDESGKQKVKITPPEKLTIVFTRPELDGYFIGIKEAVAKSEVKAADILIIKNVCKSLGMSGRFEKYSENVLSKVEKNKEPLDDEIITDPLD